MSGPLLSATGVSRRFGSLLAVDGVDLEVGAGEVVGLVGANGAGKTTLIRMLLGLLHPSAGQVRLLGEPPSRRTRARLGYVSQGLGLYEDLTVAENLAFTAQAFGGHPSHGGAAQRPSGEPPDPLHGPLDDPDLEARRAGSWSPGCRSACAGAWPSRRRSATSRSCWCWTSPPPGWTRSAAPASGTRSAPRRRGPGNPEGVPRGVGGTAWACWSPPTPWARPSSATGWW